MKTQFVSTRWISGGVAPVDLLGHVPHRVGAERKSIPVSTDNIRQTGGRLRDGPEMACPPFHLVNTHACDRI